ncbi:alkylhydroperoxidase AhpD family core domain-containing protein [Microbulbifer donghaiensis]|uniref:Alkylhydroperoxidase AhpD family core domain-containing protein n=1 Tax=Microbulbifer donghaiensis TaxID=494016 RepID=A0A1M5FPF3_9GAMM|nr:carboxymuconolactone decarboxylase family protein [Microbulbifer donghaiensis]SHF93420.1 alkylhydroperoxidase AhpD family core domain-containing protein [Microbulbifer donghaiensis]
MTARMSASDLYQSSPDIPNALEMLSNFAAQEGTIDAGLGHLTRLRVSQINNCCYCQRLHAEDARKSGVPQAHLDVLQAWREAKCFSAREKLAFRWAEALTCLLPDGVTDTLYQAVEQEFGRQGLLALTALILEINSWNRVSISLALQPDF